MDEKKAGIECRGMDIQEGKRARETRGHRTMRGGMFGCHPDATTKKIAGERETSEQKKENRGIPRKQNIRKRRDVDVRNGREMVAGLNRKREDPTSP